MTEYIDLRNAIVKQAISDWQNARQTKNKLSGERTEAQEKKYQAAVNRMTEVEVFFKSDWAKQLCGDIDPMMILGRLKDDERAAEAHKAVGQAD